MAGSVLAVGVLVCAATFAVGATAAASAAVLSQRAASAADAAALAAADTASGIALGDPCARAEELAATYGARVTGCDVTGLVATVSVSVTAGPLSTTASARAAPPLESDVESGDAP